MAKDLDKYQITFNTWNKIAELYESKFMDLSIYDKSYERFCALIKAEEAEILEIACGPGNILKFISDKKPRFKLSGIDVADKMIDLAKKNVPNATFMTLDCRNLNQIDAQYNGIIIGFCLPYLSSEDVQNLIRDCYNIMKSEAILYLSFVDGEAKKSGFISGSTGDQAFFYYHKTEEIEQTLAFYNFAMIEKMEIEYAKTEHESEIHTVLIAKRQRISD